MDDRSEFEVDLERSTVRLEERQSSSRRRESQTGRLRVSAIARGVDETSNELHVPDVVLQRPAGNRTGADTRTRCHNPCRSVSAPVTSDRGPRR